MFVDSELIFLLTVTLSYQCELQNMLVIGKNRVSVDYTAFEFCYPNIAVFFFLFFELTFICLIV